MLPARRRHEEPHGKCCVWGQGAHGFGQGRAGLLHGRERHRLQALQDEPHVPGTLVQPRARTLAPVPAAAGHSATVAPDYLTPIHRLHDRRTVLHGLERLSAGGDRQARRPVVGGEILATDRQRVT